MTLHELWDDLVPPERRWLGLLVFCSIAAHGVFFFIFKVTPPGSQGLPRRPSQVTLLAATPSIIWLDWRDPSSIALPRSPLPRLTPPSELPGLPDRYTALSELSGQLQVGSLKDARAPLPERSTKEYVPETLKPSKVVIEGPPPPAGTEIQFLGTLAAREPVFRPVLPMPPVSDVLRVTVLNMGINASGTVDAIMVEETSLDTSVDQLAVATLRQWKFKPRKAQGQEIDWGKVIIYWDYQGKPKPVVPPSP